MPTVPLVHKHQSKLIAVGIKYLKRMVEKTKRNRLKSARIREEVKLKKVLPKVIEERQLKWFGHTIRLREKRKVQ